LINVEEILRKWAVLANTIGRNKMNLKSLIEFSDEKIKNELGEYYIIDKVRLNNIVEAFEQQKIEIKRLKTLIEGQKTEIEELKLQKRDRQTYWEE
jgi:tRNA1(Val) A37 N6-methylase TrmN6